MWKTFDIYVQGEGVMKLVLTEYGLESNHISLVSWEVKLRHESSRRGERNDDKESVRTWVEET